MLPVLSLECSESHTRRVSTDTLINSDLMFHLLFDVAVKTTWAAPLAAHVWCCLQRDWSQTKCHWLRQSCVCAEAHTETNVFSNCNSSDSELVFLCTISQHITLFTGVLMPVMPFLAVVTYLRYAGTTWGKRGRPGYSLQLEDYNLIRTYCWQWKLEAHFRCEGCWITGLIMNLPLQSLVWFTHSILIYL